MPTGFYEFYTDLLNTAKEANYVESNGSGKTDSGDVIIRQSAKFDQAVEIPYRLEVAKEVFETLFETPDEMLDFMEGRIDRMRNGMTKDQCAAIFQDIQKKAVEAQKAARREYEEAFRDVKLIRKKVIKKGLGKIVETIYKAETKIVDEVNDVISELPKLNTDNLLNGEPEPEEKNPEFFKNVFKDAEKELDPEKVAAANKLLEEKLSRRAEAEFLLEQSLKQEEDCPANEHINNVGVGGLYESLKKYIPADSSEYKDFTDKLQLLSEKAIAMEFMSNPSDEDWDEYNKLLKDAREQGEKILEQKIQQFVDEPEHTRKLKEHGVEVAVKRTVERLKKDEALSPQAKKIMNGCEHALRILQSGKYDGVYTDSPLDQQKKQEKLMLLAHAHIVREFRKGGFADEKSLTKAYRDELVNDPVFSTIATKFDGSKLAEAIEDKKLPAILDAANQSFRQRKAAEEAKNAEAQKKEPGRNEPAKKEPGKNEPAKNEPAKNEPVLKNNEPAMHMGGPMGQ